MDGKERTKRPIRNKRCNRRPYDDERKPPKRLFTPEIKRFLKDWLVRRRDNPYPNRDEKKTLAIQTGLTYIQVCNWFANWRRKLKNAGKEPQRKTWGHLIKTYNSQVQGNVEHFSICSNDSIWHENELQEGYNHHHHHHHHHQIINNKKFNDFYSYEENYHKNTSSDHCYTDSGKHLNSNNNNNNNNEEENSQQCFYISSTTSDNDLEQNPFSQHVNKYKNHIMEKYLRDCQKPENQLLLKRDDNYDDKPSMISKWLESAANFKPSENNYLNWTLLNKKAQRKKISKKNDTFHYYNNNNNNNNHHHHQHQQQQQQEHGREELDAAEALTKLANAYNKSRKLQA